MAKVENMLCGKLLGPLLEAGKVTDRGSELHKIELPAGSLRIADLGYWSLNQLEEYSLADVFWLIPAQSQTAIFDTDGKRWELAALAKTQKGDEIDMQVTMGVKKGLSARLVGQRVPPSVAQERRRKLRKAANDEGKTPSQNSLRLLQEIKYPGIDGKLLSRKERAMELSQAVKDTLNETQAGLSGYKRRHFMAQVVQSIFDGKPNQAENVLG